MRQIREEIQKQNPEGELPAFEEIHAGIQQSQVNLYPEITGNFLTRALKKCIRKMITFQVIPIMTEQNMVNLKTADLITEMHDRMIRLEQKQALHQQELTALQSQIKALQKENQKLRELHE